MSNGKILSIQSHVVHGYVGNRAAVFPLQVRKKIQLSWNIKFKKKIQIAFRFWSWFYKFSSVFESHTI